MLEVGLQGSPLVSSAGVFRQYTHANSSIIVFARLGRCLKLMAEVSFFP